jgi:hypothetical protein
MAVGTGRCRRTVADPDHLCTTHTVTPRTAVVPAPAVPWPGRTAKFTSQWRIGPADDGQTDVDDLTLACGPHNRLVKPGGWRTRKRKDGRTEWIPPPHLDSGQSRVNDYHHPENYLLPDQDDES